MKIGENDSNFVNQQGGDFSDYGGIFLKLMKLFNGKETCGRKGTEEKNWSQAHSDGMAAGKMRLIKTCFGGQISKYVPYFGMR